MKKIFTLLALAMLVPATSLFAQVSVDNVSKPQDEVVFENPFSKNRHRNKKKFLNFFRKPDVPA